MKILYLIYVVIFDLFLYYVNYPTSSSELWHNGGPNLIDFLILLFFVLEIYNIWFALPLNISNLKIQKFIL